jgi:hypothetical protein
MRLRLSLWLQQLLQGCHILLHALLHDLPGIVARLRFHLGKLAEIRDGLLHALFCDLGPLRDRLGACGVFDCRLPFRQRFAEDLVASFLRASISLRCQSISASISTLGNWNFSISFLRSSIPGNPLASGLMDCLLSVSMDFILLGWRLR